MQNKIPLLSKIATWLDQKAVRDRLDIQTLKLFRTIGVICLVLSFISFLHFIVLRGMLFAEGIDVWDLSFDLAAVVIAAEIVRWSSKGIKEKS